MMLIVHLLVIMKDLENKNEGTCLKKYALIVYVMFRPSCLRGARVL